MLRCQHSHCYTLESDSDQVKQGCLKQSDKKISLQQNRRYMIMSFSKILRQLTRMERSFATQHKPENDNICKMLMIMLIRTGQKYKLTWWEKTLQEFLMLFIVNVRQCSVKQSLHVSSNRSLSLSLSLGSLFEGVFLNSVCLCQVMSSLDS